MYFVVTFDGSIAVRDSVGNSPFNVGELIESHLDAVMDEFASMGTQDPEIDLDLESRRVKLSVRVEADDPDQAIFAASPEIRSAIHGAGGATPEWPSTDTRAWSVRQILMSVRSADLIDA